MALRDDLEDWLREIKDGLEKIQKHLEDPVKNVLVVRSQIDYLITTTEMVLDPINLERS